MANISHFTQTVNGVSTTYDIHDANAIPRSGGAVITGVSIGRVDSTKGLDICGGTSFENGGFVALRGKDTDITGEAGVVVIGASNGSSSCNFKLHPNGIATWGAKNVAMAEDVVPRSGGAVISGNSLGRTVNNSFMDFYGGTGYRQGSQLTLFGKDRSGDNGVVSFLLTDGSQEKKMRFEPSGTWTWNGTACQITSDQRLKQQITEIDDKLLDAWQDVDLVQFKYNDAVETKGNQARLHTGFVVQQIDDACKKHGVDISQYGLYCHEQYPQEVEEVEIEQKDGTKIKEKKVIREASEHYSLRYTEALIVECKYLRRCVERLTARIEQLEKEQETSK